VTYFLGRPGWSPWHNYGINEVIFSPVVGFAGTDSKFNEIFTQLSHDCNNTSV
jgi:hypothetical protein